jgi:hypothetical protein
MQPQSIRPTQRTDVSKSQYEGGSQKYSRFGGGTDDLLAGFSFRSSKGKMFSLNPIDE